MPLRVLLSEGSSTSAREAITVLGLAGHMVEVCDPSSWCLGRFSRLVKKLHRCPPLRDDPAGYLAFVEKLLASNRFDVLTSFQRAIYFVTLMCSGMAVVHLIAPVSYHRILFRHHAKEHIVAVTNTMVMVGLAFTAGAVVGSLVLVTSVLYSWPIATTVAAVFTGLILWLWYLSALLRRRQAVRAR